MLLLLYYQPARGERDTGVVVSVVEELGLKELHRGDRSLVPTDDIRDLGLADREGLGGALRNFGHRVVPAYGGDADERGEGAFADDHRAAQGTWASAEPVAAVDNDLIEPVRPGDGADDDLDVLVHVGERSFVIGVVVAPHDQDIVVCDHPSLLLTPPVFVTRL